MCFIPIIYNRLIFILLNKLHFVSFKTVISLTLKLPKYLHDFKLTNEDFFLNAI